MKNYRNRRNSRSSKKIFNSNKDEAKGKFNAFEFLENNLKKNNHESITLCMKEKKINLFQSLGIFCIYDKYCQNKLYYDIFFRKIKIFNNNYMHEFFIYNISDLIIYKQIIIDDNIKKQKIFAKIAHEFKTPLNSVIGITSNIKDSDAMLSNLTCNKLDIIQNLSNYLIFLVSDIIQYTTLNDISDIKFNILSMDLRETLNFCFQILNSLLSLNKIKNENITSELIVGDSIDSLNIESDEIRIKQILLNFISNSVKFTKQGKITIKAKMILLNGENFLKISVKDTGIGINEKDKRSLFEESLVLENGRELNKLNHSLGSGLGLSICKVLCQKLEIDLTVKTEYSKGSIFSIIIPIKHQDIKSNRIKKNTINISVSNEILVNNNEMNNNINDKKNKENDLNSNRLKEDNRNLLNQIEDNQDDISVVTVKRTDILPLNYRKLRYYHDTKISFSQKLNTNNKIVYDKLNSFINHSDTPRNMIYNGCLSINPNNDRNASNLHLRKSAKKSNKSLNHICHNCDLSSILDRQKNIFGELSINKKTNTYKGKVYYLSIKLILIKVYLLLYQIFIT